MTLRWLGTPLDLGRITVPVRLEHLDFLGVVDTGATTMGIPEDILRQLNRTFRFEKRNVKTAVGIRQMTYIQGVSLGILGRTMLSDALVTPSGGTLLIGHKQLAELNLIVYPREGEVRLA